MIRDARHLLFLGIAFVFASTAHAEPEMFQAWFYMDAFNRQLPVGASATGSFSASTFGSGVGPITLPQSAFGVTTAGIWRYRSPNSYSLTYATFLNDAGSFFAGGGPAAGLGTVTHIGGGTPGGTWVIFEGKNGFGGALGLLGKLGARARYRVSDGYGGFDYYRGKSSWNMIRALGRSSMDSLNPYTNTGMFTNTAPSGMIITYTKFAVGTPWTTGTVRVYVDTGAWQTIISRQGYHNRTAMGLGYIQLVTPSLTHWRHGQVDDPSGSIGVLIIGVPEPSAVLMLMVGVGALALLYRFHRKG